MICDAECGVDTSESLRRLYELRPGQSFEVEGLGKTTASSTSLRRCSILDTQRSVKTGFNFFSTPNL